ncbi:DUF5658 family protein [Planctomicrobium sp. SH661]|uniref:DUF5658 family protein n=1 Tax=Planctomicrobium sp. SH661 TaxID=3448124 RepID=UPI003F5B0458
MVSSPSEPKTDTSRKSLLYRLFRNQLPLETETSAFILMNVLDYFATYYLLYLHIAKEHNPIANWFLEGWGPVRGLLFYKLALVTLVCGIAQIVVLEKPRTARWLLNGSTVVIAIVVFYSLRLMVVHGGLPPVDHFHDALLELGE